MSMGASPHATGGDRELASGASQSSNLRTPEILEHGAIFSRGLFMKYIRTLIGGAISVAGLIVIVTGRM